LLKNNVEYQGHLKVKMLHVDETLCVSMKLICLLMTKLFQKSQTLTPNDKVVKEQC